MSCYKARDINDIYKGQMARDYHSDKNVLKKLRVGTP